MNQKRSGPASARTLALESLEGRVVMSGVAAASALPRGTTMDVSTVPVKKWPTTTTLAVSTGTLGQDITFRVTVRGSAWAGPPAGTVNITDHGRVIETLALKPESSLPPVAFSGATATITPQPGGVAYYFGKHALSATYVPSGSLASSTVAKSFTVGQPHFTTLAGGVKVATVAPGSGAAIQPGQTANVLYTGYLAKTGQIFDDSINDGGKPLAFPIGGTGVIPGFDAGTGGMQVGETRIIEIPPAQGYGSTANGPIPANSTLIFVVTLASIS